MIGPEGADNCHKFVDILGLRTIFPLFMKSPKKIKKVGTSEKEHEGRASDGLGLGPPSPRHCKCFPSQAGCSPRLAPDLQAVGAKLLPSPSSLAWRLMSACVCGCEPVFGGCRFDAKSL